LIRAEAKDNHGVEQPDSQRPAWSTGAVLLVGLAWGLLFALLDGLPILLEGPVQPYLPQRLWVLWYLLAFYAILWAVVLLLIGTLARFALKLFGRQPDPQRLVAGCSAFSGAVLFFLYAWHRLQLIDSPAQPRDFLGPASSWQIQLLQIPETISVGERLFALGLLVPLSLGVGLALGWFSYGGACWLRERRLARRGIVLRLVLGALLTLLLPLLGRLLYQGVLRDLGASQGPIGGPSSPDYPSIVLISIDTLRADALGIYGAEAAISPHVDALGRQGVVFEKAISQAPWTYPSFLSMHTSLYPSALGFDPLDAVGYSLDSARNTLAEGLQQAGYRTQAYVTNDWLSVSTGLNQGFHGYGAPRRHLSFDPEYLQQHQSLLYVLHRWVPGLYRVFERGHHFLVDPRLPYFNGGEYVNGYVRGFLRKHHEERFFLWVHYMEPHATYNPSQAFYPLAEQITPARERWLRKANEQNRFGWILPLLDPANLAALESLYAGEVADVDALVGEVVAELERWDLLERTVIVVMADHGEEFDNHGSLGHGRTLYEELVHVPLIITGPAVTVPGRRISSPVENIDLMPTLLEIARAAVPPEVQGQSLLPLLQGADWEQDHPTFTEANYVRFPHWDLHAVREGDLKLILNPDMDWAELYDLDLDPLEEQDLLEERPGIARAMKERIGVWMEVMAETEQVLQRVDTEGGLDEDAQEILRNLGY
jgi:arylsulfatase A-like enzyme